MRVTYRFAAASDAPAIARLHAESWRVAYRGMFPDEFLDNEVFADRDAVWKERFHAPDPANVTVTILAEMNGELAGFIHSIVDEDATFGTLIDNLHVRPEAQRRGIATRLLAETGSWLIERGSTAGVYLWVLEGNAGARLLYETLGGETRERGVASTGGSSAPSLRICWPGPQPLARLLPPGRQPIESE